MPWWFWMLVWIVIVLASLLLFILLGWRLFRQGRSLVQDASAHVSRFATIADQLKFAGENFDKDAFQAKGLAESGIYLPTAAAQALYTDGKTQRREGRRLARIERKRNRNQPQALRDLKGL